MIEVLENVSVVIAGDLLVEIASFVAALEVKVTIVPRRLETPGFLRRYILFGFLQIPGKDGKVYEQRSYHKAKDFLKLMTAILALFLHVTILKFCIKHVVLLS